jgi:hypothetical protein
MESRSGTLLNVLKRSRRCFSESPTFRSCRRLDEDFSDLVSNETKYYN